MQKTVFVVDDIDTNLALAKDALKGHYRVMTLPSAAKLFHMLEKIIPDMILLDIEMPVMDGFEALRLLKGEPAYADIPVIFLTGMTDVAAEVFGFQLGAIDFIGKPFSEPVLLNRVRTHLNVDELIKERTRQLENLQNATVMVLADMVENRDKWTGGHIERTTYYLQVLIDAMLAQGVYTEEIGGMDMELLISSARLHDIGKIAISDVILNKPGKLMEDEFDIMKTHCDEGVNIIQQIVMRTDNITFLHNAKLFAGTHHERWDGTGYPNHLSKTDIPIQGRIMAIVDVYDALVSERPYKKPFSAQQAEDIIMEGAGTQFDPRITEVFFSVKDKFEEVMKSV
jgi:putative two-component system response regulator